MKLFFTCAFFLLVSIDLAAQSKTGDFGGSTLVKITGIITDSTTQKGIAGATVKVEADGIQRTIVSNGTGAFAISNIPFRKKYTFSVSALGYKADSSEILMPAGAQKQSLVNKNLGAIKLLQSRNTLATVVVRGTSAPAMQFGIDRKIFNVEKNITAQGGTAVDVMKNIPSLSVDVDGNVQMRNSTPQILIDGRPTILTLDQVPADDIERVELVTNPSAKYDASSAGGIINIVMKKNKRVGLNGIASAGVGTPGVLNGNLNLNIRQTKFNFFVSGNYRRTGGKITEKTYRENRDSGITTDYFNQVSHNDRIRNSHSIRFGADYFLDDKNTISFTQNFNTGQFNNNETQYQQYLDKQNVLQHTGLLTTTGNGTFNRSSSRLSFEHKLGDGPDNKLTADITYNSGNNSNQSRIFNNFYNLDGTPYSPSTQVYNDGTGNNYQVTGQVDYSKKTGDKRIEFGVRTFYNNSESNFGTYAIDHLNNATKLPLSNDTKYTEHVNAGYFNYANKWKSITYQAGLRVELSKFDGTLLDSNAHFGYKFPDGFKNLGYAIFPSIFITKEISENQDIQFNYSKRIRRPRFWEINPFVDINDPLNIRRGNQALKPEYTNSFELNYFNTFPENKGSFLAVVYFKNNVGDITQYSDTISTELFKQLNNAAVSPDAILNTFINAGYTNRMGAEFTLQRKLTQQLDFMYDADFQYRTTHANVNGINLNSNGFNFQTKLITNYNITNSSSKLFNNLSFQLVADYEGPRVIPQGRIKAQFVSDFAMRKEFLKNKAASLSFSVNDILNTRKFGTIYDTEQFYQDSYRRWSPRTFRITFSYKFGDSGFDLFKKRNNNDSSNPLRNSDEEQGGASAVM
ncbi:MAG TPA: outer membrane beta-barrel protein [Chitinophagaceae bacterium]|nr:outer membrane beta-barrel protein [Chitinophagaceae bacterium]